MPTDSQPTNNHEPGSVRDRTASLEPRGGGPTPEDAIAEGHRTAEQNHKAERRENGKVAEPTPVEEIAEDAHESARLNAAAEQDGQPEGGDNELRNDTSKTAKQRTAKSQLDPADVDPISNAEVNRSATNASMDTGNKTAVSNEEAADRAANPGKAEEESPVSTAGEGVSDEARRVDSNVAHPNRHQQPAPAPSVTDSNDKKSGSRSAGRSS